MKNNYFLTKTGFVLTLSLCIFNPTYAQKEKQSSLIERPAQVSFISPLGTNGIECGSVVNNFSLNIISGYSGGLNGLEIGSVLNVEKEYVKGMQIAGFGNIAGKDVIGGQIAGFCNISGGSVIGTQFSGFTNIAGDSSKTLQIAGFSNIVKGSMKGSQYAGFCNVNSGATVGPQFAGFCNVSADSAITTQFSGFTNVVSGSLKGTQIAGFVNVSRSGKGIQIAGFGNIAAGNFDGLQLSGFINKAKYVRGVQLGFINVCDSIKGIPIGFLSIVRNGYRHFEITGSEGLNINFTYKMGSNQFYNILTVGVQEFSDKPRWGWGYGLGTEIKLVKDFNMNIELVSHHINEDSWFTHDLNLLNQLKVFASKSFSKHLSVFAGPTLNVMVSQDYNQDTQSFGSHLAPWIMNEQNVGYYDQTNIKTWIGMEAGIRF